MSPWVRTALRASPGVSPSKVSGGAGELPPYAPTEPYVKVSPHTALVVEPLALVVQVPMRK